MAGAAYRLLLFVALAAGSATLWLGFLDSGSQTGDMVTGIPRVMAQSVFAPAPTASAAQPGVLASFGADVTTNSCRGCTLRLSAGGGIRARVATGSLQRHAYAVLNLGGRAIDGQIAAHDVIGLGLGETPVTFVHVLQMSDAMHRVIYELVADPRRRLHLYSPAGGLRNRPLDIALGATVPNDGVSGVAVDIVKVANGVSVYVNGVRTVRLTGLSGATTSAPRYLAAGVVRYSAPRSTGPLTAVHAQVSVTNNTTPPVSTAPPPAPASAPTPAPVTNRVVLAPTSPPTISGDSVPGSTLSADAGTWTDSSATFTYRWQRCDSSGVCAPIDEATRTRYTLSSDDAGAYIRVRVTATSATSTATAVSAAVGPVAPAAPVAIAAPVISGDAVVGSTLTASSGTWSDPAAALSYSWRRCDDAGNCTPIDGATATTYTLTSGDVGSSIRIRVTATNAGGSTTARSVSNRPGRPGHAPRTERHDRAEYQRRRDRRLDAHGRPRQLERPLRRLQLRLAALRRQRRLHHDRRRHRRQLHAHRRRPRRHHHRQRHRQQRGRPEHRAPPQQPPRSARPRPPHRATRSRRVSAATRSSARRSRPTPAAGATPPPPSATSGSAATPAAPAPRSTAPPPPATRPQATTSATPSSSASPPATRAARTPRISAATAPVGPATPPAPSDTIAPSISGDAIVGSTLTADPGSWSDPSAAFSYVWQRCDASGACTTIDGATAASYTPTGDDLGDTIIVSVTASNAGGQNTAHLRSNRPGSSPGPERPKRRTGSVSAVPTSGRIGRADEAVIGRRVAAALLVILIAGLSGVGVLLSHDIRQRERSAVAAHLGATLEVALTEIANEAAQAQQQANSLATRPSLQRALARADVRSLARMTADVRGATAVPAGRTPPAASALTLQREVRVLAAGQLLGVVMVVVPLDGALLSQLRSLAPLRPGEGFLLVHGDRIAAAPVGMSGTRLSAHAGSVRLRGRSYLVAQSTLVSGPKPTRLVALAPAAEADGPVAHATLLLILSLLATLATLLVLGRLLARPVLGPLRTLAREAQSAGTDELTQLANRRTFTAAGNRELARVRRSHRPLAVALIDVDDFKWVNDTFGHAAGDYVLRAVAEMLRTQIRTVDLAARYGGDEFALLLPETDTAGAFEAAERFRIALATRTLGDGRRLPTGVTASIGVATGLEPKLDELIAAADRALYRAKQAGKNRTADATGVVDLDRPSANRSAPSLRHPPLHQVD